MSGETTLVGAKGPVSVAEIEERMARLLDEIQAIDTGIASRDGWRERAVKARAIKQCQYRALGRRVKVLRVEETARTQAEAAERKRQARERQVRQDRILAGVDCEEPQAMLAKARLMIKALGQRTELTSEEWAICNVIEEYLLRQED